MGGAQMAPALGGEVVEGQQRGLVVLQARARFFVFRPVEIE
jgi:hypothetical protein